SMPVLVVAWTPTIASTIVRKGYRCSREVARWVALHLAGKPGRLLAALEEELGFDSFMDPAPKTDHGRLCPPCVAHFTAKGLEGSELLTPSHSHWPGS